MPPIQLMKQMFANKFFYMLYFQEPGVAEAELEADVYRSLRTFLCSASGEVQPDTGLPPKPKDAKFLEGMPEPKQLPSWLTEADLDHYTHEFERTGFRGGLNRYRNMDRDWEQLSQLADAKVKQPALFIAGDGDGVLTFTGVDGMKADVPNLRKVVMLPGCGHWTQQERPPEPTLGTGEREEPLRVGVATHKVEHGGGGGIRTHGTRKGTHAFQACPIVHSGTPPDGDPGTLAVPYWILTRQLLAGAV